MNNRCCHTFERKNYIKAESTGWRHTFHYPGGGTYRGCWLNSQPHRFGIKETKNNLIYDGQWCNGKRQGYGVMRRRLKDGTIERIYIGQWCNDLKSGEGKQFFEEGTYYGWWKFNRRNGLGIQWYKNGELYMGEWKADTHHGLGVLFYANGHRYEGYFAGGMKNGEGTFYHVRTGQVQKGMWENDICKVSMLQDEYRQQAKFPTEYSIPQLKIVKPSDFIRELFGKYKSAVDKPSKSLQELICLNFLHKINYFAKFEPQYLTNSKLPPLDNLYYSCSCKKAEKLLALSEPRVK